MKKVDILVRHAAPHPLPRQRSKTSFPLSQAVTLIWPFHSTLHSVSVTKQKLNNQQNLIEHIVLLAFAAMFKFHSNYFVCLFVCFIHPLCLLHGLSSRHRPTVGHSEVSYGHSVLLQFVFHNRKPVLCVLLLIRHHYQI